ncbi:MAG: 3-deoxy-7-phosphoheptulonate synthase [Candidatus Xenobia bacterium]
MIVVLRPDATPAQIDSIKQRLEEKRLETRVVMGTERSVIAVIGKIGLDVRELEEWPGVAECVRISRPYKLASREAHAEPTTIAVGPDIVIGGPQLVVMAGPCAVESREVYLTAARACKAAGATILRGGAFKPRTSPYAFQGLGEDGLKIMAEARAETGLPIVSEIVSPAHVDMFMRYVDIIQIGARNMQNFELLKAVAGVDKPVLLKRGLSATIEELLMAAEYIMSKGINQNVILCERGIRTYESSTRNTLDLSAVPVLRTLTHLPVVVDPSHGTGHRGYVLPMALAGIAAGADGIIIEVHPNPAEALSDGPQSLLPRQLERLIRDIEVVAPVVGRQLYRSYRMPAPPHSNGKTATDVAYQGQPGAFSERASRQFFGPQVKTAPQIEFRDVFEAVVQGRAAFGVLPIENSLTGSIHQNYDHLLEHDVRIVGELKLRIVHSLIAAPGVRMQDIKTIYAHPQAAGQCDHFLREHPEWSVINVYDTAGSVDHVKQHGFQDAAAIASAEAASLYGMEVLKEGIESHPSNFTRFIVIAPAGTPAPADADKTSIVFSTENRPGALLDALKVLSDAGINMVKLESRPIPGQPWEYMFYADLQTAPGQTIDGLQQHTRMLRVLGSYHAAGDVGSSRPTEAVSER